MQSEIINHLKETFQPDAIILHGSRARRKERPHSDWDFIFLYTEHINKNGGRLVFQEQNIEYSIATLPIDDIYEVFGAKLQEAKVVYEKDNIGTALLNQAADYYAHGVHWSPEKIQGHRLWVEGRINGMKDNIDNPVIFEKYFADFYGRVFNYWYWILQHKHSQPIYVAVDEIAEQDAGYYELVSNLLTSKNSRTDTIEFAKKIAERLFE